MRDKRFNCGAVLTVIKMYRYLVYEKIFVTVNCGAGRYDGHHSKPRNMNNMLNSNYCMKGSTEAQSKDAACDFLRQLPN